jgi:hypothetical protein
VVSTVVPAPRSGAITGIASERRSFDDDEAPGVATEPGDRLRYALERPGQADIDAIVLVETATSQLFDLEHHRPARALIPTVGRHLDDVSALLAGTRRESLRRRLAVAGGQAAALAGWLAFERGDAARAHRNWDSALAAAKYAADGPLLACVLTYLSYSSAERGDPATAWQLAHSAVAHAGADERARAWMAARAAEEAALLGERRAALAELDLALNLGTKLIQPGPDDTAAPWTRFFYRATLAAMAANVHGRLGSVQSARDSADWALRTVGGEPIKSRALIMAEIACAFARAGELEPAIEAAHCAVDLAERLEVTLARRRLRALIPMLAIYSTSPPVRELLTRLTFDEP